jgi:hypothetical protein
MILTMETGMRAEFMNRGIVKMMLDENNPLTAQLMREVQVQHKVKTGNSARAFMFQISGPVSKSWIDSLLRKIARISQQQIPVALIFESQSHVPIMEMTDSACRIFSDDREANDWLVFTSNRPAGERQEHAGIKTAMMPY